MADLEWYYRALVVIQLIHSQEEIWTHFDATWKAWPMTRRFFLISEAIISPIIILVAVWQGFPARDVFMAAFNVVMLANGVWHIIWGLQERKYVPGLVTAPFLVIIFLAFYFNALGLSFL